MDVVHAFVMPEIEFEYCRKNYFNMEQTVISVLKFVIQAVVMAEGD